MAQQASRLTLAGEKTVPQIILPATPTEAEKFAAEELSTYLGKITSKTIPVISNATPQATAGNPLIILGNHPLNADLHPEKLEVEEAIISVEPGRLRITGGWDPTVTNSKGVVSVRDRGVMYGVYELLDRLGVRWFRPDPWGEHVPQQSTVTLPLGKDTFKPAYKYRGGFNIYGYKATKEQTAMAQRWSIRNRHAAGGQPGGGYGIYVGHNLNNLMPQWKYFKEHPEYFALVNGVRKGPQLCMGNPAVQEEIAKTLIQFAKDNPTQTVRSIEPYDSLDGYCECDLCRAMDDPNLTTPAGEKRLGKASMSNRLVILGNYVARRLREEGQNLSISWYAYATHFEAPTKVDAMEPNILVGPTTIGAAYGDYSKLLNDPKATGNANFLHILNGWSKYVSQTFVRDYWSGGCWYGPLPYLTFLTDRTRNYRNYKVQGVINEVHPSWGAQTMAHYFAVRLQVNPDIDVEKELEYFCNSYYGPAGKPMLEYYRTMEKASLEGPPYYFSARFIDRLFLDDKLMEKLNSLIAESKKLIGDQQPYAKRFEGMEAGHEVARVRNLVERYKREKNVLAAVTAWDALGEKIKANRTGDIFNINLTSYTWKVMSDQAGIPALRKQLATMKQNPNARILQNLNEDWKFSTDSQKTGLQKGVTAPTFSDRTWHTVNATSTWQDQGHTFFGTTWYRKAIDVKKENGKRYALFFGAIDGDAVIYVNGTEAGKHLLGEAGKGWDEDFMIDITDQLKSGQNLIAIQVTKNTAVGGIFKGVSLMQL